MRPSPCCAPPHGRRGTASKPFRCRTSGRVDFVPIILRKATLADIAQIEALIARSARGLSREDYRPSQIEGALRGAFGVDTQLLADQTYFIAEEAGRFVGCGGWSYRRSEE